MLLVPKGNDSGFLPDTVASVSKNSYVTVPAPSTSECDKGRGRCHTGMEWATHPIRLMSIQQGQIRRPTHTQEAHHVAGTPQVPPQPRS